MLVGDGESCDLNQEGYYARALPFRSRPTRLATRRESESRDNASSCSCCHKGCVNVSVKVISLLIRSEPLSAAVCSRGSRSFFNRSFVAERFDSACRNFWSETVSKRSLDWRLSPSKFVLFDAREIYRTFVIRLDGTVVSFLCREYKLLFFTVNPSHIEHFWRASPLEKGKEDEKGWILVENERRFIELHPLQKKSKLHSLVQTDAQTLDWPWSSRIVY